MNVCILTSRPVGQLCIEWARNNTPDGFTLVDTMNHTDIVISVMYDKILPIEYLRGLTGAFNYHPGILPEYRGAATFSWAIVNKEKTVGITLHKIDDGIDTGDIIDIVQFPIGITAEETFNKAEEVILSFFKKTYVRLLQNDFVAYKQDESKARTYYRKDLERLKDISPVVRALTFQGKESCYFIDSRGEKNYITYK